MAELKVEDCFSELTGTFFLVLTVGYNVLQKTALAPVSIGAILMAMIFATGKVSGGHFNPAVTIGVALRGGGGFDAVKIMGYMGCQILGGFIAGFIYMHNLGATFTLGPGAGYSLMSVLVVEVLFSAALVFVVLSVATTQQDDGNWYYGLAIGFTVMASAFAIGPISGCSLNPAVTIGVMFSHFFHTGNLMISRLLVYTIAPCLGATLAVILFNVVRAAEFEVPLDAAGPSSNMGYIQDSLQPQKFPGASTAPLQYSSSPPGTMSPPPRTSSPAKDSSSPSPYARKDAQGNVFVLY